MGWLHGSQPGKGPNLSKGETGAKCGNTLGMPFDKERKERFLEVIRKYGQRPLACIEIGVSSNTVTKHLKEDPEFREAFEEAHHVFRSQLVKEAYRRGVAGVDEPIFNRGRRALDVHPEDLEKPENEQRLVPASIKRYSDSLLHALLKANLPEFTDKQIVQSIDAGAGNKDAIADLPPDKLEKLQKFLEKLQEDTGEDLSSDLS